MGFETSTLKHILLLLNFVFAVLGLILFGFGIFVLVNAPEHRTVVHGEETTVDIGENLAGGLIIALGVAILFISIFGCLAAIHESKRRLLIFIVILCAMILIQLLLSSMTSQGTRDGLAGSVEKGFKDLWEEELKEPGALAYYEKWLHCCGVNGTDDYVAIKHDIPKTCCEDGHCTKAGDYFTKGCEAQFNKYLASKMLTFNIVNCLLIMAEIAAAVFGWLLFSNLKNESRRSNLTWI
ncbi:tetraspanin-9 [Musca domestica]|uniref:Tetraspanin n=1 Tax=Musca domestica TaxID=7370 RepID=A0A1I8M9Q4_MUSDO|nr:tetraspanin-9 [Musca domestica]XP_011290944.1 tetraspanin-9 [Musca domestica]